MRDSKVMGRFARYFVWVAALGMAAACGERSYGPRLTYERPHELSERQSMRALRDSVAQGNSTARAFPALLEALEKLEIDFEDQGQAEKIERKLTAAAADQFLVVSVRLSNLENAPDRDLEVDLMSLFTDVAADQAYARCTMHLKSEKAEVHDLINFINSVLVKVGEDKISSADLRKGFAIESWYESKEDKKMGRAKNKIHR